MIYAPAVFLTALSLLTTSSMSLLLRRGCSGTSFPRVMRATQLSMAKEDNGILNKFSRTITEPPSQVTSYSMHVFHL